MARRRRRRGLIRDGAIFPFVSVLFSTIGALALLWAAGSLENVTDDPGLPRQIAEEAEAVSALERQLSAGLSELGNLDEARGTLTLRLDQLRRRADEAQAEATRLEREIVEVKMALSRHAPEVQTALTVQRERDEARLATAEFERRRQAVDLLAKLDQELAVARAAREALAAEVATLAQALAAERQRLEAVESRHRAVTAQAQAPRVGLSVPGLPDGQAAWIEVSERGFCRVGDQREAFIDRQAFLAEAGDLARLVAGQEARRPVLLVRPEAHLNYHAAAAWLRQRRVQFSSEPVAASWRLELPVAAEGGRP